MLLFPRLPQPVASYLAEQLRSVPVEEAARRAELEHPEAFYTPTGGSRAPREILGELREALLARAQEAQYPAPPGEENRLAFDIAAAIELHARMDIAPGEAAKPGLWDFLCCALGCDLVRWRFPGGPEGTGMDRFLGGRRNTLQRLWWRSFLLHDPAGEDPYRLLRRMGEDELVQLMERPSLAGNRRLTRTVAAQFLAAAAKNPGIARRLLIREAQKRLMRLSSFALLDALDDSELVNTVTTVFSKVVQSVEQLPPGARAGSEPAQSGDVGS